MLESLQSLACADPPIVDPVSRTVVGILDITCGVDDVSDLVGRSSSPRSATLRNGSSHSPRRVSRCCCANTCAASGAATRPWRDERRHGHRHPDRVAADGSTDTMIWDWITGHLGSRQDP